MSRLRGALWLLGEAVLVALGLWALGAAAGLVAVGFRMVAG